MRLKDYIYLPFISYKWRKKNKHNYTKMHSKIDVNMVNVGNYTYGPLNILSDSNNSKLKIGHCCSIGPETLFVLNSEHATDRMSSYPFQTMCLDATKNEALSKGNIIIDDDVWIGTRAIIMSGVHICQGAVIAAGAVVTKDVPPYTIVGGMPAKPIKQRFSEDIINFLLKVDFSKIDDTFIKENIDLMEKRVNDVTDLQYLYKIVKE